MARFSIVTACRNSAKTIEQCVRSVGGQEGVDLEHIVVDGSSTDGTLGIVERYRDDRTVIVKGADQGIADAFNRGLARATGDVIGFLNGDDWYASPRTLATVQRHLQDDRTIVCGAIDRYPIDGAPPRRLESKPGKLRNAMRVWHPAMFVPLPFMRLVGDFDVRYRIAVDFDHTTRLKLAGGRFVAIGDVLTCMRTGGASSNFPLALREDLDVKNRHYGRVPRNYAYFLYSHVAMRALSAIGRI